LTTQLDIKYDPAGVAAALKAASTQILVTAKAMDSLGSSAVGAAEDIYGFESAEWKAATAAEKAEREVRDFAEDLDYVAREAKEAAREVDNFGDKAVKAGTATGSFKRAGSQIGSGLAGAIGGAAAGIVGQLTQIFGEKFKEAGKQSFFSAMLQDGQPALAILGDVNLAFTKLLENVGLVKDGTVDQMIVAEEAARFADEAIARENRLAEIKRKSQEEEAERLRTIQSIQEGLARVQAVLSGDQQAAETAERERWTATIKTLEEVDSWYKSIADAAKLQASQFEFTEQKAKELEGNLQALRDRRANLEKDARDKKEKADKEAADKTLKQNQELQQKLQAQQEAADAEAKRKSEAAQKGIEDSGVVDELLGSQSEKDVNRQVLGNRRGEFAKRAAEIDEAPDSIMSRRQKTAAKREAQREIFKGPASAGEKDAAAGQLAQATIAEAKARGGLDQETAGFMAEALKSKIQQGNDIQDLASQVSKLRQQMQPKTRAAAQRTGRN